MALASSPFIDHGLRGIVAGVMSPPLCTNLSHGRLRSSPEQRTACDLPSTRSAQTDVLGIGAADDAVYGLELRDDLEFFLGATAARRP